MQWFHCIGCRMVFGAHCNCIWRNHFIAQSLELYLGQQHVPLGYIGWPCNVPCAQKVQYVGKELPAVQELSKQLSTCQEDHLPSTQQEHKEDFDVQHCWESLISQHSWNNFHFFSTNKGRVHILFLMNPLEGSEKFIQNFFQQFSTIYIKGSNVSSIVAKKIKIIVGFLVCGSCGWVDLVWMRLSQSLVACGAKIHWNFFKRLEHLWMYDMCLELTTKGLGVWFFLCDF